MANKNAPTKLKKVIVKVKAKPTTPSVKLKWIKSKDLSCINIMKTNRTRSMTSQIVMVVALSIVGMQLYNFYLSHEVLEIFNTLASMALGHIFKSLYHLMIIKMTYHNKRANREVQTVILVFLIAVAFTLLHTLYLEKILYNTRIENNNNIQEFVKVLWEKEKENEKLKEEMKGMIKKPSVKKNFTS